MAPVGEGVRSWAASGSFSPEVVVFSLLFLLLTVLFLTLCTNCQRCLFLRRSFELGGAAVERTPSQLIRVVKLEDALAARENPMINEIKKDEKEFSTIAEEMVPEVSVISPVQESSLYRPWRSHKGAPEGHGKAADVSQVVNGILAADSAVSQIPGEITTLSGNVEDALAQDLHSPINPISMMEIASNLHSAPTPISMMEKEIASNLQSAAPLATIVNGLDPVTPAEVLRSAPLAAEVVRGVEEGVDDPQHLYEIIGAGQHLVPEVSVLGNPITALAHDHNSLTSLPDLDPTTTTTTTILTTILGEADNLSLGLSDRGWNPMYARVSKKSTKCPTPPPVPPPEDQEEEESSPPLPERSGQGVD